MKPTRMPSKRKLSLVTRPPGLGAAALFGAWFATLISVASIAMVFRGMILRQDTKADWMIDGALAAGVLLVASLALVTVIALRTRKAGPLLRDDAD